MKITRVPTSVKLIYLVVVACGMVGIALILVFKELAPNSEKKLKWDIELHRSAVNTSHLKPPQEENVFYMNFANYGKHDLWVVWSDKDLHPLGSGYRMKGTDDGGYVSKFDIDCVKLGGQGRLSVFQFIGGDLDSEFNAILLKPGARVVCRQYPIVSHRRLEMLSIFLTQAILVDGTIALQDWLPFDVGNYGNTVLDTSPYEFGSGLNRVAPAWKSGKGIPDFQKLHLDSIQFDPIEIYQWNPDRNSCSIYRK